jgi:hypothetical protein
VLFVWAGSEVFLQTSSGLPPLPAVPLKTVAPPFVAATPTPVPVDTTPVKPRKVNYESCKDAQEHGALPLLKGQPGYRKGLDQNRNGVACENYY